MEKQENYYKPEKQKPDDRTLLEELKDSNRLLLLTEQESHLATG
ncbi:hypothetical protein [Mucilaginibacter paludis]|uniref:Uncharacterized protein n=1 Tax=Mucilaginibacter paludis DSM 18603 TaxID=714943 RepID=H1YAQ8_9SPHI|nr:hypothetical protein [Mucilaginibacter paludis]EHQ29517.1 hypothetical protein Mucpa_5445 [Mucilaginibacter paludis DSM 18603]